MNVETFWNQDYQVTLKRQTELLEELRSGGNPTLMVGSHPSCLTYGRGLQKKDGKPLPGLVEFNPSIYSGSLPLHTVKRGGGLTFHHSGQLVAYPITKLNPKGLSLSKLVCTLLKSAKAAIYETTKVRDLETREDTLGLWRGPYKLASVGIAIDRLCTYHGLALNVGSIPPELSREINSHSPCGLSGSTYTSVSDLAEESVHPQQLSESFIKAFGDIYGQ